MKPSKRHRAILAGLEQPDDGELQVQQGLRRFYVPQEPVFAAEVSVFDAVSVSPWVAVPLIETNPVGKSLTARTVMPTV